MVKNGFMVEASAEPVLEPELSPEVTEPKKKGRGSKDAAKLNPSGLPRPEKFVAVKKRMVEAEAEVVRLREELEKREERAARAEVKELRGRVAELEGEVAGLHLAASQVESDAGREAAERLIDQILREANQ